MSKVSDIFFICMVLLGHIKSFENAIVIKKLDTFFKNYLYSSCLPEHDKNVRPCVNGIEKQ